MAMKSQPKKASTSSVNFDTCQRSFSSGSIRSVGPILSMDLRLDDIQLDGGGGLLGALSSDDIVISLRSAELVQDILLPDIAAAASAALKAEQPSVENASNDGIISSKQQGENIAKLTSKMEKLSTSDEIALLDEKFWVSSGEWLPGFDVKPVDSMDMHPSMLLGNRPSSTSSGNVAASHHCKSPTPNPQDSLRGTPRSPPLAISSLKSPPGCQAAPTALSPNAKSPCLGMMHPPSSRNNPKRNSFAPFSLLNSSHERNTHEDSHKTISPLPKPPTKKLKPAKNNDTLTAGKRKASTGKKVKKRRPRLLDTTRAVEKTDRDILFGRGGVINYHPGNVKFREKAVDFLPWYIQSSKEEKEKIANLLVESVENEGRRFLEKKDGVWYKVVRGQHTKACATLRDLKDGMKKKI